MAPGFNPSKFCLLLSFKLESWGMQKVTKIIITIELHKIDECLFTRKKNIFVGLPFVPNLQFCLICWETERWGQSKDWNAAFTFLPKLLFRIDLITKDYLQITKKFHEGWGKMRYKLSSDNTKFFITISIWYNTELITWKSVFSIYFLRLEKKVALLFKNS